MNSYVQNEQLDITGVTETLPFEEGPQETISREQEFITEESA